MQPLCYILYIYPLIRDLLERVESIRNPDDIDVVEVFKLTSLTYLSVLQDIPVNTQAGSIKKNQIFR